MADESKIEKIDPFSVLPEEVSVHTLTFFSNKELTNVASVSANWHRLSQEAIWRKFKLTIGEAESIITEYEQLLESAKIKFTTQLQRAYQDDYLNDADPSSISELPSAAELNAIYDYIFYPGKKDLFPGFNHRESEFFEAYTMDSFIAGFQLFLAQATSYLQHSYDPNQKVLSKNRNQIKEFIKRTGQLLIRYICNRCRNNIALEFPPNLDDENAGISMANLLQLSTIYRKSLDEVMGKIQEVNTIILRQERVNPTDYELIKQHCICLNLTLSDFTELFYSEENLAMTHSFKFADLSGSAGLEEVLTNNIFRDSSEFANFSFCLSKASNLDFRLAVEGYFSIDRVRAQQNLSEASSSDEEEEHDNDDDDSYLEIINYTKDKITTSLNQQATYYQTILAEKEQEKMAKDQEILRLRYELELLQQQHQSDNNQPAERKRQREKDEDENSAEKRSKLSTF